MRLSGRTALVTGGASGIGRAICLKLVEEGANVASLDPRRDPLEGGVTTEELLAEYGGRFMMLEGDVSHWGDVDRAVAQTVERFGRLDIMVNNAAIGCDSALLETSEEDFDRVLAVNTKGVFFGCKRAVQQFLDQDPPRDADGAQAEVRGRIVNISSQHGMICAPQDFAYGVGKASVVYMTRQIASDYAKQGIVCNAVAPGKILTGRGGAAVSQVALSYSHSRTPWPRLGRPLDVAKAVAFLASDEATYITGENLMVDGGWMAN